jgi:hypothetical protein
MSKYSCYRVRFELQNAAGKQVSGPYTMPVGISGGSRGDQHTPSVASSLASAVNSNLGQFIQDQNNGAGGAPGGTVTILGFDHGVTGTPDIYV